MEKKIFLLLLIFISTVLSAIAQEYYPGSSALAKKQNSRRKDEDEISSDYDGEHTDNSDDEFPAAISSRRNRYHGYGSTMNGAKSRWASIYDDDEDVSAMPWSKPNGFGLDLSSIIPGLKINMPSRHDSALTCHSIFDQQYPMFSDICGVMPQARYTLPNFFGHVEKWQIAQSLAVVLGPSAGSQMIDPACNRALRLLVCPLLFPPCKPRRDVVSMLPCQSFCRGVKAQCPGASIEHLPCEYLAPTSDICPVNPLPYTSLMNSFSSPFPFGGPQLSNLVPPSPLGSFLTQQQTPTAPVFGQGPFPTPQLFGHSPFHSSIPSFSLPLSQNSVIGQSPPASTPTLQSLLQMQGNNLQAQGLSSQSLPSLLQSAGIYGSPMIQPQYQQPQQQQQQYQQQQQHQHPYQQQQQQHQHQYQQQQQQHNIQSPLMKSFDATKFIAEGLSPVIVDIPELGPISDLRKPTTSKIFPALRSANEKI